MSAHSSCLVTGCRAPVRPRAPIALCEHHFAVAADWMSADAGVTDLLPSPCRLCGSRVGVRHPTGWICAVCEWRAGELPDQELPPPRIDVVYYLRLGDRVKIGTTFNPRQRFAALLHDEVLAFERGDRMLEQRRHAEFADDRLGTSEWFGLTPRLRAHIDVVAAGRDAWEVHARWISEALALRG